MPIFPRAVLKIPGLRIFVPRVSVLSRPLLPLTSSLAPSHTLQHIQQHSAERTRWLPGMRLFHGSYTRLSSASPPPSPSTDSPSGPPKNASLSQRLKYLMKTYGWYALGVYTVLTVLDFGVAFAGVNIIGAEQVSKITRGIKEYVSSMMHSVPPEPGTEDMEPVPEGGREGLYAMIILAYTIHKTVFLPFRVGLTAAITPKLVGWLTRRGWAGGQGTMRAAREMRERVRRRDDRN